VAKRAKRTIDQKPAKGKLVTVNDKMQRNYRYRLVAPAGRVFDPEFKPELTPREMLRLGVFCGKYLTDCRKEFPASWFAHAKLARDDRDCALYFFSASMPANRYRNGVARAGCIRTIHAAGSSGTAAIIWVAAWTTTAARSSAGRRSAATCGRCRSIASRAI
jgi:hypothetical protein